MQYKNRETDWFRIWKGVGVAFGISLLVTVVLAALLQGVGFSTKVLYTVNQTVKVFAVVLGALLFVKGERGWLQGVVIGLLFTGVSYLAFSAIGGDFSTSWLIVAELALAAFAGAVGGIVAVNVKR